MGATRKKQYHWTDVAVLWAMLEQDYDAVDNLLTIYRPEALLELSNICNMLQAKATKIYFKKTGKVCY